MAGETTPDVLVESLRAIDCANVTTSPRVSVPTLALHGTLDKIVPYTHARRCRGHPWAPPRDVRGPATALQAATGQVNHLIRDFVLDHPWRRGRSCLTERKPHPRVPAGPRRGASSGCRAHRPSAISSGPRHRATAAGDPPRRHCGFPTASPRTGPWEPGARPAPASRLLQNESGHFESWARDHELHAQNAMWDMGEIMAANS